MNTASVSYLRALFDYLEGQGVPTSRALGGLKLALDDRAARLPESDCAALFDRAAEVLQDPALGLHVGERIRPGHYGVLGYVAMNSGTLGEALSRLNRYQALVIDLGAMDVQMTADQVQLSWQPDQSEQFRQLAEFNYAGLVTFARWISGQDRSPVRIEFTYSPPADVSEHRRVLGGELRFNQSRYAIAFPLAWLQMPLIQPDPAMRAMMLRLAEKQMLALPRGDAVIARARGLVARHLSDGELTLEQLAARLDLSPRTLQRKLADSGMSFTQLVDAVRRELAERYLADPDLDLNDLAFLLGFSEQSAFQRAFRRWKGVSPGAWRKRLQN